MSFSAFSKDFTANMFTCVENQFITKYLPQADGDAVRAYLYGLYLCQCAEDFDAESCAKLLKITPEKLVEIFGFWEECDLVQILSREPLFVEYLPVNAAVGKPKPVRPEKYAEFNREFYKLLQKAGRDFKPYEMQRILEFLENNPMEQQAFLLVAEYCAKKDGEKLSSAHILNKAAKLVKERKYTYEQVEQDLNDFNAHEREMSKIFSLLGLYKKPQDADYDLLEKWTDAGVDIRTVYLCATSLKKGNLYTLDALVSELRDKGAVAEADAKEYLARREETASVVFSVARKLGVKVQNPRPFAEEYAEKWLERGYDGESLTALASLCMKLGYGFSEMDGLIEELYSGGIVDSVGVKEYCAARDKQFRLLRSIEAVCGVVKKTQATLDMIAVWHGWNFSDEMILEAAKKSANAAAPVPYINKLLSEWKRLGAFTPAAIPEKTPASAYKPLYKDEAAIAADKKSEREHYYAVLRQRAQARADKAAAVAAKDESYRAASAAIKAGEIELAKAEIYAPETVSTLSERLEKARRARADALLRLGLSEKDLLPKYQCDRCSDTGYLPDGALCDCYKPKRD